MGRERELDTIPIFPLENVVLFPRVPVPLYMFEPRYRQMTADAIDEGGVIGMVTVRPEHRDEMAQDPPVFPIGCAGRISQSQRRPDGTFNVSLLGLHRFRILDEPDKPAGRLYRSAVVERLADPLPSESRERIRSLRGEVFAHVCQIVRITERSPSPEDALRTLDEMKDELFVNSLSQSLDFAPLEKQGLLEAETLALRFERLAGLLSFQLATLRGGAAPDRGLLH